jgi:two-component system sensor histidine kinase SenX3
MDPRLGPPRPAGPVGRHRGRRPRLPRASPADPARQRLQVHARIDDGYAEISIADSGLGIPPEDTERIFERFYRGRNAAATTGTGLGLAIALWIITQHTGHITVTGTPGVGSRFAIRLPLTTHPTSNRHA